MICAFFFVNIWIYLLYLLKNKIYVKTLTILWQIKPGGSPLFRGMKNPDKV